MSLTTYTLFRDRIKVSAHSLLPQCLDLFEVLQRIYPDSYITVTRKLSINAPHQTIIKWNEPK